MKYLILSLVFLSCVGLKAAEPSSSLAQELEELRLELFELQEKERIEKELNKREGFLLSLLDRFKVSEKDIVLMDLEYAEGYLVKTTSGSICLISVGLESKSLYRASIECWKGDRDGFKKRAQFRFDGKVPRTGPIQRSL
jgi:hypothetical protein